MTSFAICAENLHWTILASQVKFIFGKTNSLLSTTTPFSTSLFISDRDLSPSSHPVAIAVCIYSVGHETENQHGTSVVTIYSACMSIWFSPPTMANKTPRRNISSRVNIPISHNKKSRTNLSITADGWFIMHGMHGSCAPTIHSTFVTDAVVYRYFSAVQQLTSMEVQ